MHMFNLVTLLSLQLSLTSALSIPGEKMKRSIVSDVVLYAYGQGATDWPLSYGLNDSKLYITSSPEDTAANLAPVKWSLSSITDENWMANATLANGTSLGSLYIMHSDAFNSVGVSPVATISKMNGTVTGFGLFATQLVYNDNSNLESQFWAQSTSTDGIYALMWNADGGMQDNSFPVLLKYGTAT
ncbi:hypothetical protein N8I77_011234 [Diaporthe amygdali]|uniref:Uncharacterized protein n=1 Tax=Phomopsis amygdali TaxID=1214568 RepID=A0AAD9S7Z3_PHOAM|nr:hypothetical protein N8I77_011234 [Diaporthe amygdali]